MNKLIDLTKRNIKLYLRDKSTVFFSFISSIIIIAMFVLFMGKGIVDNTVEILSEYGTVNRTNVQVLIFLWMLGGIIVLNSISIPQMILSRIILDKEAKTTNDFYVIPFKRSILGLSYIASALIVGTVITYLSFLVGEVYIYAISGQLFSFKMHMIVLALTVLCTTSFSSIMYLIYLFVKTSSSVGGLTALTSSAGGFLAGVYITIGSLSGITKDIISSNPLAHATSLIRTTLMNSKMATVFQGLPSEVAKNFGDSLGVNLYVGDTQLTSLMYIVVLSTIAIVCFGLSYFKLKNDKI